jgi:hypothetical protein
MRLETDAIGLTAVILVLSAYVLFGCVFLFRKKPPQGEEPSALPRRLSALCCKARASC